MKLIATPILLFLIAQDPKADFEKKLAKAKIDAAKGHAKIADYLDISKMHKWARFEDEKAVKLDPDNESARKHLGYKKDGEAWVKDPEAKTEYENKKKGDDEARIRQDYDSKLASLGKEIAKDFFEAGTFAKNKKLDEEAKLAFQLALEYEPDSEKIRKELKYEKTAGGWMSPSDKAQRDMFRGEIAKEPSGEEVKDPTEYEKELKLKHNRRKSPRAFIESPHMDQKKLTRMCQLCEHSQSMFKSLFDVESKEPLHLIIFKDKKDHEAYIDKFYKAPEEIKKLTKNAAGSQSPEEHRADWWQSTHPDDKAEDWVVHYTCHLMTFQLLGDHSGGKRPWLHEAIAYYFTTEMLDSIKTYCIEWKGTAVGGDPKKAFDDPKNWPSIIRGWMKDAKDPSIHAVFKCILNDLDPPRLVKAWSLVDFFVKEHRAKFNEFCAKLKGDFGDNGEKALKELFGWTLEDLDEQWRTWAKRKY